MKIDLSADAFYAVGEDYQVVITTGTVDGTSVVGYVVAEFSIENRFERGTDSALLAANVPTNFSALGIESDGDITKVNALDGHTAQTGDSYARLGAPAGASVSADVAAVKVDTAAVKLKTDNLPEGIKKNTAYTSFMFMLVLSSDHVSPSTSASVTGSVSIDGAAFTGLTNSASIAEVGSGLYQIDLAAADLNGVNFVTLRFIAASTDDRLITLKLVN